MKIVKYEKKGNNNYLVYFDNNEKIKLNEDIILKYKLLYKKDIDEFLLTEIIQENNNYDIYDKCVNYISVRLRSINEMKEYMQRKNIDPTLITTTIDRLLKNKLLNDEIFAKAFIKDKLNFTTMGPYRIEQELKKHHIDNATISKNMSQIDEKLIEEKIEKQVTKLIKSHKSKPNLRNKIYTNLMNLGYPTGLVLTSLSKHNI